MLTVNWNCYHDYQKFSKVPGAPVFVEVGRLCHGAMASPSLLSPIHATLTISVSISAVYGKYFDTVNVLDRLVYVFYVLQEND